MNITTLNNSNGKAQVIEQGNKRILFSYETKVAEYNTKSQEMKVFLYYSATTGKHINNFFRLFGIFPMTKKELFKKYNLKK